ncbi:MAG: hypothetical protein ACFFCM_12135 [Promethearchaeota archaeon]
MKKNENFEKKSTDSFSIYIQAALAMMFIQLLHKFVRELGLAIELTESGIFNSQLPIYFVIGLIIGYAVAIILSLLKFRMGFVIGMILGIERIALPIIFHVILGIPSDPIYYPVFCITQGSLVIFFSYEAYKNFRFIK